jgi:hypothetical protein
MKEPLESASHCGGVDRQNVRHIFPNKEEERVKG